MKSGTVAAVALLALACSAAPTRDEAVVRETLAAIAASGPLAPPSERHGPLSVAEAYRVQDRYARARGDLVGYKIAFASPAAQAAWGLDAPVYGPLFASQRVPDGGRVSATDFHRFRLETEIAFVLDRAIDRPLGDVAALREHVASVHVAFDLPDGRFASRPTAADVVATGAGAHRFVLGPPHDPNAVDLRSVTLRARKDGETVYEGPATAVKDGPWGCLLWAVDHLTSRGHTLPAGAVFLGGAVDRAYGPAPADAPAVYTGEGGPLGTIRVVITR